MTAFLGIDAGTTALKAALFDTQGKPLSIANREYSLISPAPGIVELDAETYWDACCGAVREALAKSGIQPSQVAALSISSQGETFIALDAQGNPTRRAIVWLDNRSVEEARLVQEAFPVETIYQVSGQPEVMPTWTATKILWMKRHEPQNFNRTAHFLLVEEYLLYRLTGCLVGEVSLQTSTLLVDIQKKTWFTPMLDFVGITPRQLPELTLPGKVVAPLSAEGAAAVGLTPSTLAVSGGLDQAVGAVGSGNTAPGIITENTGAAMAIIASLSQPYYDPGRRIPLHHHACTDTYCLLLWSQTAGMALRWLRDQFFQAELRSPVDGVDVYDRMTAEAATVQPGSDGMIVLPHLEGAACPEFDPAARAVFYGASLHHTRAHFVRALMESIAYMLKKNLDLLAPAGIAYDMLYSTGGGARSRLWLEMKASLLEKPILTLQCEEVACLGAAVIAAAATGEFTSPGEAAAQMVRRKDRIDPIPAHTAAYQEGYARYLELYDRLKPMWQK